MWVRAIDSISPSGITGTHQFSRALHLTLHLKNLGSKFSDEHREREKQRAEDVRYPTLEFLLHPAHGLLFGEMSQRK